MLAYLSIKNLAVVRELSLEFHEGFNVLTGETGTGKSILINALGLVLGARARTEVIRSQTDQAVVEAVLDLKDAQNIRPRLEEAGLDASGDELIIRRTITLNGRNRLFINGSPSTIATLRKITDGLVEISGQHEYYSLLKEGAGLAILDTWAGLEDQADQFKALYQEWQTWVKQLKKLKIQAADIAGRADYLRFQVDEITACKLVPGELEDLRLQRDRLRNRDKLLSTLQNVHQELYSGNQGAIPVLGRCINELTRITHLDPGLERAASELETARITMEEAVFSLARLTNTMEDSSRSLEEIEDRLNAIHTLCRKHGPTVEDVLERHSEMTRELARLENMDALIEEAEEKESTLAAQVTGAAAALSENRRRAALPLSEQITGEMNSLMMEGAGFRVQVERASQADSNEEGPQPEEGAKDQKVARPDPMGGIGPDGVDRIGLLFKPSRDGEFSPLSRTASGGELSRVMLAVKRVLMAKDPCETYVFDEIDAGIGGVAADIVGNKLRQVANTRQVICVTHLPQIAAQADCHLVITKGEVDGRTESAVTPVTGPDRVREMARMLSGQDMTSTALAHAEEMMARRTTAGPGDTEP